MNIAVIQGGSSPESAASAQNARAVQAALKQLGHRAQLVGYDAQLAKALVGGGYNLAFIATQGKGHGDGTCQAVCEWLGLAYTGTRVAGAALVNDKAASKKLCAWQGIPTPAFAVYTAEDYARQGAAGLGAAIGCAVGYPAVAKPRSQGGSLGIVLLQGPQHAPLLERAFAFDSEVLVEKFVPGGFVTVGVLEMEGKPVALPPVTARRAGTEPKGDDTRRDELLLFDKSFTALPASLPPVLAGEVEGLALSAFRALGGRGYARVDFMLDARQRPWFLEMNAVPGLKAGSFFPFAAQLAGLPLTQVCRHILQREGGDCTDANRAKTKSGKGEMRE